MVILPVSAGGGDAVSTFYTYISDMSQGPVAIAVGATNPGKTYPRESIY
jgi:hypothetical protein